MGVISFFFSFFNISSCINTLIAVFREYHREVWGLGGWQDLFLIIIIMIIIIVIIVPLLQGFTS